MSDTVQSQPASPNFRVVMTVIGILAGLASYVVVDVLPQRLGEGFERLTLTVGIFSAVLFICGLMMAGPMRIGRAMVVSLGMATVLTPLFYWASLRFSDVEQFMATGHPAASLVLLCFIAMPFVITRDRIGRFASYPDLFAQSWGIVVRYAVGMVFVAVVWGVVMLSDALLSIVGVTVIDRLLGIDVVPYVLSWMALGLGLAVVDELQDYVSPFLLLRLLRLLLPVFLVVVVVFLLAVPLRGLGGLFGGLSAAMTLMGVAICSATLITASLDVDTESGVQGRVMRNMARGLALCLPILSGLACWAVWLRVDQYGWTPDRVIAAIIAALCLLYGVVYGGAVVRSGDWGARIRRMNIYLAYAVLAVALLILTPLLNPQRMSVVSQMARFESGAVDLDGLDLWALAREWGVAGEDAVAVLRANADEDMRTQLAKVEAADSQFDYGYRSGLTRRRDAMLEDVLATMPTYPAEVTVDQSTLESLPIGQLEQIHRSCNLKTPEGNPNCLYMELEMTDLRDGVERLVAMGANARDIWFLDLNAAIGEFRGGVNSSGYAGVGMDALHNGAFSIQPVTFNVLTVGDARYSVFP